MGRTYGHYAASPRGGGDRSRWQHSAVYEHPIAGRGVVSSAAPSASGLGGRDRATPWITRSAVTSMGGARAEGGPAPRRRVPLEPRPRRGFFAGRTRVADRKSEGHRPTAAKSWAIR